MKQINFNKKALVLGSSKGIGKAIAFKLAEAGANIIVCSRKIENLQDCVDEASKKGYKIIGDVDFKSVSKKSSYSLSLDSYGNLITEEDSSKKLIKSNKYIFLVLPIFNILKGAIFEILSYLCFFLLALGIL